MANTTPLANLSHLEKPDVGLRPNQWGADLNLIFDGMDDAIAGALSKSVAGAIDVTLSTAEAGHHSLIFTGALSGAISVIVPTEERQYRVLNSTTGAFALTVKTAAGSGIAVRRWEPALLTCDGVNVIRMGPLPTIYGASAGSANAYTLTPSPALTAYDTDLVFGFRANFAVTAAATLNVSGLGAKTIKKIVAGAKADLAANDIISGQPVQVAYDGTDMVMMSPLGVTAIAATQAEQETGTSVAAFVTPGQQHFHPSAAKCWGIVTESGGVYTLQTSFNVTSILKNATGDVTVTIATDFSGVNYAVLVSGTGGGVAASYNITNAGAFRVRIYNFVTAADANAGFSFACFGDQA